MERRPPLEPFRPSPIEPGPFGPPVQRIQDDFTKMLKEIMDRLNSIDNRLKNIEQQLKTRT